MNIGINCLGINPNYRGGINSYTFGLLDGLINRGRNHNFQIYLNRMNKPLFNKYENQKNFRLIELPYQPIKKYLRRISLLSLNKNIYKYLCDKLFVDSAKLLSANSDIIYTPTTYLFPFNISKPTVVSMHDIQQFHYPQFFSKKELLNRRIHFKLTAELASYIQASSQFIKSDILEHFHNIKEEQIVVINEGVDIEKFSIRRDVTQFNNKYKIPKDFLFFPAQLWHHKNHITVLEALKKIKMKTNQKINLVLTGAKESAAKQIFDFINDNDMDYVFYLGLVPIDDLLVLYQRAKFLITAVLYESSSLPILEAAAAGTPIIASKTAPNLEMSQILSLNLFEPTNSDELSTLILKIWNDELIMKSQITHNSSHIDYYSWDNVATKYLTLFENIIKN